jgi:hypothetical protein
MVSLTALERLRAFKHIRSMDDHRRKMGSFPGEISSTGVGSTNVALRIATAWGRLPRGSERGWGSVAIELHSRVAPLLQVTKTG